MQGRGQASVAQQGEIGLGRSLQAPLESRHAERRNRSIKPEIRARRYWTMVSIDTLALGQYHRPIDSTRRVWSHPRPYDASTIESHVRQIYPATRIRP